MVVVILIGIALVAIATGTTSVAGAASIAASKTEDGELARQYALSGMERVLEYLDVVAAVEGDYDRLLDRNLTADCSTPPASNGTGQFFQPRFNDATLDVSFEGRRYAQVNFAQGGYLVRIEDDADDAVDNDTLAALTGNNNPPASNCGEGPAVAAIFQENRMRDRNRAVWVTVIGFTPGTAPIAAVHRFALRRLHQHIGPMLGDPAVVVGDDFDVNGGGQFSFCSNIAGIGVEGALNMNGPGPQNQTCGPVVAGSNGGGDFGDNSSSCPAGTCIPPPASTQIGTVTVPPHPNHSQLVGDPTAPDSCVFFFSDAANDGGLYFWDSTLHPVCETFPSARPEPNFVAPLNNPDECWAPIFLHNGTTIHPVLTSEMNGSVWEPNDPATTTGPITVAFPSHAYNTWTGTISKPQWSDCGSGLLWERPGTPAASMSCVACDGNTGVMDFVVGGSGGRVRMLGGSPQAFPAGIYFRDVSFVVSENASGFAAPPDDANRAQWPAVTLVVEESFTADGTFALGFGTGAPNTRRPSLIVDGNAGGNLTYNSPPNTVFAGTVWARTNMTFNSTPSSGPQFHGTLVVGGDLNISSGAKMNILYDDDLGTGGGMPRTVASVTSSPGSY